jgi:hypothetical protein
MMVKSARGDRMKVVGVTEIETLKIASGEIRMENMGINTTGPPAIARMKGPSKKH